MAEIEDWVMKGITSKVAGLKKYRYRPVCSNLLPKGAQRKETTKVLGELIEALAYIAVNHI